MEAKSKKEYRVGEIVKFTYESEPNSPRHGKIVTIVSEDKFIVKII